MFNVGFSGINQQWQANQGQNAQNQNAQKARQAQWQQAKQQRYDEVYRHELAHKTAAGSLGGNIVIEQDSNGWAYGGHVDITIPGLDTENPEKTKEQALTVIKSAMAPSDPSGQDYKVAGEGRALLAAAEEQIEKNKTVGSKLDISA